MINTIKCICPNCKSDKIMRRYNNRVCLNCGLMFELKAFIGNVTE